MASLVLGAAGAAVGSFFGPLGTSIGWAVGAALGNALFPGKGADGPRLSDLKVHNSSYGQMIPITYGTVRIAGCIIWCTDWVEHEQHSGGKGGPEETSYTYTISFAVGLCEGPISGVLRIWADSRLVWDPTTMDPADFPFTLYLGDATQMPDPTIEAEEGAGNVSGHRGMCYAVFTDFLGKDYGNRIPSLTFEVYTAGGPVPWRYASFTAPNLDNRAGPCGSGPQSGMIDPADPTRLLISYIENANNGTFEHAFPVPFVVDAYSLTTGAFIENVLTVSMDPPAGGSTINSTGWNCFNNVHIVFQARSPRFTDDPTINGFFYDGVEVQNAILDPIFGIPNGSNAQASAVNGIPHYNNGRVYAPGGPSGAYAYVVWYNAPGGVVNSGSPGGYGGLPGGDGGDAWSIAIDTVTDHVWAFHSGVGAFAYDRVHHFDADLVFIESFDTADFPNLSTILTSPFFSGESTAWNGMLTFSSVLDAGNTACTYKRVGVGWELTDPGSVVAEATEPGPSLPPLGNMISLGNGLVYVSDGIVSLVGEAEGILLKDIVSDVSVRAGLTTDQIDVEELTDVVDGYIITNQMAARSAIEPLQVAWPFDAVEHDVVVRFPRRGVDGIQAIIDDDDLGAFVPPGDPPALLTTQRLQEVDLPRIVDVTFLNLDTDYQNGEARAARLITTSELTTSLQLPIVMSSQKALSVCNEEMYNAWIERERFSLSLSRKWLLLEPADVIQANGRTMRITKKVEQADGVVKIDSVATSLAVYTHLAPPVEGVGMPGGGGTPPTAPPVIQDTDALLLDLPLIADADNPVGFYAAFAGSVQPSWPGATLYKSIDGGSSFNPELLQTVHDTFGSCSTTLGDFTGGNIVDELNSLTVVVSVGSGTLASVTNLALLNGANMAAVGIPGDAGIRQMEVIQFRDATLTATRTYTLTGLLRGRRGSEWMIPSHTSGETFVLLPTSTNVLGDPAELYLPRIYRAITSGRPLASGADIDFTNWGIAALPYAPCHLGGGRQTNGDILLQWVRRTRIGGLWRPFVDVPLSESLERYRIKIYTDSTYASSVRNDTVDDIQEYTYTLADQMTDFGSPTPGVIYWGVSQLGTLAWGTEAKGTL